MPFADTAHVIPPRGVRIDGPLVAALVDPHERRTGGRELRPGTGPGRRRRSGADERPSTLGIADVLRRNAAAEQLRDVGEGCPVSRREVAHGAATLKGEVEIATALVPAGVLTHGDSPSSVPLVDHSDPPPHAAGKATGGEGCGNGPRTWRESKVASGADGSWDPIADPWHRIRRGMPLRAGHNAR